MIATQRFVCEKSRVLTERGCSSSQLIYENEGVSVCVSKNDGGFSQLDKEGRLSVKHVVGRADSGQ